GAAGLGRGRRGQGTPHRRTRTAPIRRTAYSTALFLLALSPGQRAVPIHRPVRPRSRVRAKRSARNPVGEVRGSAGPVSTARRGRRIPCRSALIAGFGAPPSAGPQPTAEEGEDAGGADPPAGGSGRTTAGGDDCRRCALDRPDL